MFKRMFFVVLVMGFCNTTFMGAMKLGAPAAPACAADSVVNKKLEDEISGLTDYIEITGGSGVSSIAYNNSALEQVICKFKKFSGARDWVVRGLIRTIMKYDPEYGWPGRRYIPASSMDIILKFLGSLREKYNGSGVILDAIEHTYSMVICMTADLNK